MVLGLSATIPDNIRDIVEQHAPIFDTIDLEEAKKNGWVSDFIVYQLGIQLDDGEQREYEKLTDKFYSNFSWFDHNFDEVSQVLNDNQFASRYARKKRMSIGRLKGHASRVMNSVQERKKLLYTSKTKVNRAADILDRFDNKLSICFSQRTTTADAIGRRFPNRCFVYHSNIDGKEIDDEYYGVDRLKEWGIDQFSDDSSEINILSTAKAMDMGVDIPDMDLAIITSASSKSLQAIQRIGRVLRKEKNKVAIVVDIFAEDTQDEWWLRSRYKDFPTSSIRRISSIEEIDHL